MALKIGDRVSCGFFGYTGTVLKVFKNGNVSVKLDDVTITSTVGHLAPTREVKRSVVNYSPASVRPLSA